MLIELLDTIKMGELIGVVKKIHEDGEIEAKFGNDIYVLPSETLTLVSKATKIEKILTFKKVNGLTKAVVELLGDNSSKTHEQLTRMIDPENANFKTHHQISAILSGRKDLFINNKVENTWSLI